MRGLRIGLLLQACGLARLLACEVAAPALAQDATTDPHPSTQARAVQDANSLLRRVLSPDQGTHFPAGALQPPLDAPKMNAAPTTATPVAPSPKRCRTGVTTTPGSSTMRAT